jgi:hypothetical protein
MKKAFIAVTAVLLALLVAAGVYILIDRSRFEDFLQGGVQEYRGYTRVNIQKHVYCLPDNATDTSGATDAGIFVISGTIQPKDDGGSMKSFLGSIMVSSYPPALDGSIDFSASRDGDQITVARMTDLDGGPYQGTTYWLMMSAKDPDVFAVMIYEDGQHIATVYPGNTPEEALEIYNAYWAWFPGNK